MELRGHLRCTKARAMKIVIALALAGCATEEPDTTALDDDLVVLDGFFPIAADYQPHNAFDKWKHRGVNTVIRVPGADNLHDWTHEAKQLGLKMIREPDPHPNNDKDEPDLLAWHWRDEPELHGIPSSSLADFRERMHDVDPKRPIIVNFWGGGMRQANSAGCFSSRTTSIRTSCTSTKSRCSDQRFFFALVFGFITGLLRP